MLATVTVMPIDFALSVDKNDVIYNCYPMRDQELGRKQQLLRPKNGSKISGSRC